MIIRSLLLVLALQQLGLAQYHVVKHKGKYGLIDGTGREVLAPQFDWISAQDYVVGDAGKTEIYYMLTQDKKLGWYYPAGNKYVAPRFEATDTYNIPNNIMLNGYSPIKEYVNRDSLRLTLKLGPDQLKEMVEKMQRTGLISHTGELLVPCKYESVSTNYERVLLFDSSYTELWVKDRGIVGRVPHTNLIFNTETKLGENLIYVIDSTRLGVLGEDMKWVYPLQVPEHKNQMYFEMTKELYDRERNSIDLPYNLMLYNYLKERFTPEYIEVKEGGRLHTYNLYVDDPRVDDKRFWLSLGQDLKYLPKDKEPGYLTYKNNVISLRSMEESSADNCVMGYLDMKGQPAISADYKRVGYFTLGLAFVEGKDGFGMIDTNGTHILEPVFEDIDMVYKTRHYEDQMSMMLVKPEFRPAEPDSVHLFARVHDAEYVGIVNSKGRWVIPAIYHRLIPQQNGYLLAGLNAYMGVIDTLGRSIITIEYDQVADLGGNRSYGYDEAAYEAKEEEEYSADDAETSEYGDHPENVLELLNPAATNTSGRYWLTRLEDKVGLKRIDGTTIFPLEYESIAFAGPEHIALKRDGLYGLWNTQTEEFVLQDVQGLGNLRYGDSLIAYMQDGRWGLAKLNGKPLTAPQFDNQPEIMGTLAIVAKNKKEGLLNHHNEWLLPAAYADISFMEGVLTAATVKHLPKVMRDRQYGNKQLGDSIARIVAANPAYFGPVMLSTYISEGCSTKVAVANHRTGQLLMEPAFNQMYLGDSLVPVRLEDKWGYVSSTTWAEHLPAHYRAIAPFSEGLAYACDSLACGFIDYRGHWVIPAQYDSSFKYIDFDDELVPMKQMRVQSLQDNRMYQGAAILKPDSLIGVMHRNGEWLIAPRYHKLKYLEADSGYYMGYRKTDSLLHVYSTRGQKLLELTGINYNRTDIEVMKEKDIQQMQYMFGMLGLPVADIKAGQPLLIVEKKKDIYLMTLDGHQLLVLNEDSLRSKMNTVTKNDDEAAAVFMLYKDCPVETFKEGVLYGLRSKETKEIVQPAKYLRILPPVGGRIAFMECPKTVTFEEGNYQLMAMPSRKILPGEWEDIDITENDKLLKVTRSMSKAEMLEEGQAEGIINTAGKVVIPPVYSEVTVWKKNIVTHDLESGVWLFGLNGKKVGGPYFWAMDERHTDGYEEEWEEAGEDSQKDSIKTKIGPRVLLSSYDNSTWLNEVNKRDRYLAMDFSGNVQIYTGKGKPVGSPFHDVYANYDYTRLHLFAASAKDSLWGTINLSGEWIIKPQYRKIFYLNDTSFIAVTADSSVGVLHHTGRWLLQPVYSAINGKDIYNDPHTSDSYSYDGEEEDMYKPASTTPQMEQQVVVELEGKKGVMSLTGRTMLKPEYGYVVIAGDNIYRVAHQGKNGYVDGTGKWLWSTTEPELKLQQCK